MSTYKSKTRIGIDLTWNMIVGLAILLFGFYFWRHYAGNPINEFRLITKGRITNGYVTKAEESSEYVEQNDGRAGGMAYQFYYNYYFNLPNGKRIYDSAISGGALPEDLCCLEDKPYEVKVEYLSSNPTINRVKDFDAGSKTIGNWLWRKVLLGGILLIGCLSIGVIWIRNTIKEYKKDIKAYKDAYSKYITSKDA